MCLIGNPSGDNCVTSTIIIVCYVAIYNIIIILIGVSEASPYIIGIGGPNL